MALQNRSNQVNPNPSAFAPIVNPGPVQTEQVDFEARINSELAALNQAVDEYANDGGKTQAALINARQEVNRLAIELENAKRKLQELERAGSSIQKIRSLCFEC
jgi:septal ring factor EnvC (AmiA/AmiB activator)